MRALYLVFAVGIFYSTDCLSEQATGKASLEYMFPSMPANVQEDIVVQVGPLGSPQPCPIELTNLFSNSNLFSAAEAQKIAAVALKYRNVTTNNGPADAVFKEMVFKQQTFHQYTNVFPVACFVHTNSIDREEVASFYDNRFIVIRYRNPTGDGYDAQFVDGWLILFQEYKNNLLNGLFLSVNAPNNPDKTGQKCNALTRMVNGKVTGKYIGWDENGKIAVELEFKKPVEILKYLPMKGDLSWEDCPKGK